MGRERAIRHPLFICVIVVFASTVPAFADGTVTFDLLSSSAGATVPPGHVVDWTITATVSTGDNVGLALVSVDLVQDAGNPKLFDIPQAVGVPVGMEGFDRPAGITNPGPEGSCNGGTQVGPEGAKNLLQIGGAQNTFGAPSDGLGQDVDVEAGIGRVPGGQEVASDSFPAPATPGVYTFWIQPPAANNLEAVYPAPQWSPMSPATTVMDSPSISFTVCRAGDINGDYVLTLDPDVPLFVDILLGAHPGNDYAQCAADVNGDGSVNGKDTQSFVDAMLEQGCRTSPPASAGKTCFGITLPTHLRRNLGAPTV